MFLRLLPSSICVVILLLVSFPASSQPQLPREETWVTNGQVQALKRVGDILYVGGRFSYIGPNTGGWVPVDASSGLPLETYPKVDGQVLTSAPDGAGGWYIGGLFTLAGDQARSSIAHILANGTIDPAWDPGVEGSIEEMAVSGSTLYIGGSFTSVDGQLRNNIAAIDTTTGSATAWDPDASAIVRTVTVSGSTVYVGGQFFNISGVSRHNIAALDATTGTATAWNPDVDGANTSVYDIVVDGSTIYVGGYFTGIGGQSRKHIAALDATTGDATAWNPGADHRVNDLAVSGTTVYAGGVFGNIGGAARYAIAAIDSGTGLATDWYPEGAGTTYSVEVHGGLVYVGTTGIIGGQTRSGGFAIDPITALPTAWNPDAGSPISTFGFDGDTIFVGGSFNSLGGVRRTNIAAINAASGIATEFEANLSGSGNYVTAIDATDTTVFVGGRFVYADGEVRNGLAALDASTGDLTDWAPNPNSLIYDMEVAGSLVYISGSFTYVGAFYRSHVAAIDIDTGIPTNWGVTAQLPGGVNAGGIVTSMVVTDTTVYLGGLFSYVNTVARGNIAAVDVISGALLDWDPSADKKVSAMAISGSKLYAGGGFTTIGGQSRNGLAAIDLSTGAASDWNPNPDQSISAIAVGGSNVYAGGAFSSIGGQVRNGAAALDVTTGLATAWSPDSRAYVLHNSGPGLHVGGSFTSISGGARRSLAIFDDVTPVPLPELIFGDCAGSFESNCPR